MYTYTRVKDLSVYKISHQSPNGDALQATLLCIDNGVYIDLQLKGLWCKCLIFP